MHDDQADIQQQGGCAPGTGQSSGSSGSASLASTQVLEWGRNDSLPLGDAGHVDSGPQGSSEQGESRDTVLSDYQPVEDPVLRAWFNVVAGVGEIVCPDARVVVRDAHAFMTCMMMAGLFTQQGLGVPFLAGDTSEAQGDERIAAASVMTEPGRVVPLMYNMLTGRGTVYHPRGRVEFEDPNDLWVQVTY